MISPATPKQRSLRDAEFKSRLQKLRQTDNVTNWMYIFRAHALLLTAVGGALWFYHFRVDAGLAFAWNIPVTVLAVMLVGAGQHQLAGLAHEAVHRTLFRNKHLNDLAADWLCSLPIFSSTFHYGLHHLAHHQFVNDPIRDPDLSQMKQSGHKAEFPLEKHDFWRLMAKQLWLPNLFKYSRARAEYDSIGTEKNPYIRRDWKPSKLPQKLGAAHLLVLLATLGVLSYLGDWTLLIAAPIVCWIATMAAFMTMPESAFYQSLIKPVISVRARSMMRISFFTFVLTGLTWGSMHTGEPLPAYFGLLWVVPIFTSFAFYNVLRQVVQHGNADRGWLTNTRVFHVNPLLRFAVFPIGQDYHLPHHMFSTVPHYRLKELHEVLLEYPEYQREATVVEGYVIPQERPAVKPTVMDVLGPDYAPEIVRDVYIDNELMEQLNINKEDKAFLKREGEVEQSRLKNQVLDPS